MRLNGRKQIRIESDTEVTVTVLRNTGRVIIPTYRTTLSADATVTPSTFKSGYGFETKVNYSIKTKLIDNDGDYCSSWGNSRSTTSKVKDPTKATVYIPWSVINRFGTQSKSIAYGAKR